MNQKLKIVADANMPHLDALFGQFAELVKLNGRAITSSDVADADALICRSITQVNSALLNNSSVQFVGTATIGTDHLQTDWLDAQGIRWANAAGCNAAAVAQYVLSGIAYWLKGHSRQLGDIEVGIVGAGNVGSQLADYFDKLQVRYRLCDPPLQRQGDKRQFESLENLLKCDVITLHVPITSDGPEPTRHMINASLLNRLRPDQLLINAARGEVVDNVALVDYLQTAQHANVILDVFENEPLINPTLAKLCLLATPHIAGHTLEGKSRGSVMVYQTLCNHFKLTPRVQLNELLPAQNEFSVDQFSVDNQFADTLDCLLAIYDIHKDSERLKALAEHSIGEEFDALRKNYPSFFPQQPRRDYSGWQVSDLICQRVNRLLASA